MLVLAIVSIVVSGIFGFIGVWFSKKSGKNLTELREVADRIENTVILNRENIEKVVSGILRDELTPVIETYPSAEVATIENSIGSSTARIADFFTKGIYMYNKVAGSTEDIKYTGKDWKMSDNPLKKNRDMGPGPSA